VAGFTSEAQERMDGLSEKLCLLGFENVKVLSLEKHLLVCLENNVYRWDVEGIAIALDAVSEDISEDKQLNLYLLDHGIPQIHLKVQAANWKAYRKGELPRTKMEQVLSISSAMDQNYQFLIEELFWNSNLNKIDFVVYPQLALQNTGFNQIYEKQINLAPAMEVDLWKGMQFTGQVIFPLANDLGDEGDKIRPGFVTLAQNFRFGKSYFGRFAIGNFNANRYGAHAGVSRTIWKNKMEIEADLGVTGSSLFYKGRWLNESINDFNWFLKTRYFHNAYGLEVDLSYGKYIYGDEGVRVDVIRHFGSVAVGFYVINSGGKSNGGFNFTMPLPTKKRNRKRMLRVMPANYFDWEYNAGTEFVKGQFYETRPNANKTEHIYNPIYIKSQLLHL